jgi:hypothetical protein
MNFRRVIYASTLGTSCLWRRDYHFALSPDGSWITSRDDAMPLLIGPIRMSPAGHGRASRRRDGHVCCTPGFLTNSLRCRTLQLPRPDIDSWCGDQARRPKTDMARRGLHGTRDRHVVGWVCVRLRAASAGHEAAPLSRKLVSNSMAWALSCPHKYRASTILAAKSRS